MLDTLASSDGREFPDFQDLSLPALCSLNGQEEDELPNSYSHAGGDEAHAAASEDIVAAPSLLEYLSSCPSMDDRNSFTRFERVRAKRAGE